VQRRASVACDSGMAAPELTRCRSVEDGIKTTMLCATAAAEALGPSGASCDTSICVTPLPTAMNQAPTTTTIGLAVTRTFFAGQCVMTYLPADDSKFLCCFSGQAQIDQSLITPIAFDKSEADNCFIQSCKMTGIAGADWSHPPCSVISHLPPPRIRIRSVSHRFRCCCSKRLCDEFH